MIKSIKFIFAILLLHVVCIASYAGNYSMQLTLRPTVPSTPSYPHKENNRGNRKPGLPLACTFDSERGIEFVGQETPDFTLYEIYVTDTECIYASGDEFEFIESLFSLTGQYQICLTTADGVTYAGYVQL